MEEGSDGARAQTRNRGAAAGAWAYFGGLAASIIVAWVGYRRERRAVA